MNQVEDIEGNQEHIPIIPQRPPGLITSIDNFDRKLSAAIHQRISHYFLLDYLILSFGLLFNRGGCALTVLMSGFLALYLPQTLPKVGNGKHYNEAALYMVFNILAILTLLIVT